MLVLDGDPSVADATAMLLEVDGHEVRVAAGQAGAMAAFADGSGLDLITTGLHLGGSESGVDVIDRLRERSGRRIPAIVLTGDASPQVATLVLDADNVRLLRKPVSAVELTSVVRALIQTQD